jgi:AraC-like DNA-binding protein
MSIAQANRMSVRYVHMLFGQIGVSVSSWIRMQRLERCKEALRSRSFGDTGIAEIAYSWGFRNPTHFSRIFKEQYGINPRDFREGADARARQR